MPKKNDIKSVDNNIFFSITHNEINNNSINFFNYKNSVQEITDRETKISNDYNNFNKNHISTLKKLFFESAHLNSQEISFGNYYVYDKHCIDSGTYGTVFLGAVKETNIKVAIKELKVYEDYKREKGILSDIRGIGNFPEYYDSVERGGKFFIIESLTGPSLYLLLSVCDGKFDLYTTLNIGIDVISNLEILHNFGYIHRDLKPSNLFFGSLSKNKIYDKLNIGILDFGNSVSVEKQEKIISKKGKFYRYGKKIFSSNNVLDNRPCQKIDDLISVFYILIMIHNGTLPWIKYIDEKNTIDCKTIKGIREKFRTELLCKDFPKKFKQIFENLLKLPQNEIPNYSEILRSFKEMKEEYVNFYGEPKYKFEWIEKLEFFKNKDYILLTESSIDNIKEFISCYGLNIEEYINFIIN